MVQSDSYGNMMETKICNFKIENGRPKKCTFRVAADVGWERSGLLTNAQDAFHELMNNRPRSHIPNKGETGTHIEQTFHLSIIENCNHTQLFTQ